MKKENEIMKKLHRKGLLIVFLLMNLFISKELYAQLSAGFTTNKVSGCSPILIQFVDQSGDGENLTYHWDFGNGNSSSIRNPQATYIQTGEYIVTLTISDGVYSSDTSTIITVYPRPQVNFSTTDSAGCMPFVTSFNDLSLSENSTIVSWLWDFGDGHTSSMSNPGHTYLISGEFPVSLEVEDNRGCKSSEVKSSFVSSYSLPIINFTADHTIICHDTVDISFTNLSQSNGLLFMAWEFDNQDYSFEQSPHYTFNEEGQFDISLTLVDTNGCMATSVKDDYISVYFSQAEFSTEKQYYCIGEEVNRNVSSAYANQFNWNFDDGTSSNLKNAIHSYDSAGSYSIVLNASVGGNCPDSYTQTVVVEEIVAAFESDIHFSCEVPVTISYINNSINGVAYEWNFGNGNFSLESNPSNTYTSQHVTTNSNLFSDTLVAISTHGCSDSAIVATNMQISLPHSYFSPNDNVMINKLSGCIPLSVSFYDQSIYETDQDDIITRSWNFGNGQVSTSLNPVISYPEDGTFNVTLQITTGKGCTSTSSATVRTGYPQVASFIPFAPDTSCAIDPIGFTDTSEDPSLVNRWVWLFSDGELSFDANPSHEYTDTGYVGASLTVGYNNCLSESYVIDSVAYILSPVAFFSYSADCENPYVYSFAGEYTDVDSFFWDFGDGSPIISNEMNPVHQFGSTGEYMVKLTSYNETTGCTHLSKKEVYVREIESVAALSDLFGCPGIEISFNADSCTDETAFISYGTIATYLWDFDDGSVEFINEPNVNHVFENAGIYSVSLVVEDVIECRDTSHYTIKILQPKAEFTVDVTVGCTPLTVHFTDQSSLDTIGFYSWTIDDSLIVSQEPGLEYTFAKNGNHSIFLTVEDILGCTDSISYEDLIFTSLPSVVFSASDSTICVSNQVNFSNNDTSGISSFYWSFGNGQYSTEVSPMADYTEPGLYNVSLSLIDSYGCQSTLSKDDYINVQAYPTASFNASSTISNCYPLLVDFIDESVSDQLGSWNWNFGDNQSVSHLQHPEHNYGRPGSFNVSLIVNTTNGCADTASLENFIEVNGPYAEILTTDSTCIGNNIELSMTNSMNIYDFSWDMGDGNVIEDATVNYNFDRMGYVYPRLLLFSDADHTCDKYVEDSVYILELLADFRLNDQNLCLPVNLDITNFSYGADELIWNFGDGVIYNGDDAHHVYNQAGNYTINLQVLHSSGCSDTSTQAITIFPSPIVEWNHDSVICVGDELVLDASGGVEYEWFQASESVGNGNPLIVFPDETANYELRVTDTNSCQTIETAVVTVLQMPELNLSTDTTVIIGETAYLSVSSDQDVSYFWAPSEGLSCTECSSPIVNLGESTSYTVVISDKNGCFDIEGKVMVTIKEAYTLDVPTAFTPNNDGINDIVFVNGWGIVELISFRIYNQWGEQLFESKDINTGWDGYYKNKLQESDTYVYYAEARQFNGKTITSKGDILLIR